MKTKIAFMGLIMSLMLLPNAFSQNNQNMTIDGEIGVTGVWIGVDGKEGGRAKFTEYRDLREDGAVFGRARLDIDTEKYFLNFNAGDFGYDTQFYEFQGGLWGKLKFDLFYDEVPHNLTFDARTYFLGAGHDTLVGIPNTNVPAWDTFDYSILRHRYGGSLRLPLLKPFFFDVSYQRENRDGIKPAGIAPASPGGIALELPEPVDYITTNLKVEGGYAKKPLFLSLGFIFSDFTNRDTTLAFTHPIAPFPTDILTLPPDNTYYKGFFKGAFKLPFNSKFNVNLGYASARSDWVLLNSFVDNGAVTPLLLSQSNFNGEINTQNYSFVLTSNPVRFLDAKVFYSFFKRDNKNDVIVQVEPGPEIFNNPLFEYNKNAAGVELGVKLPAKFYLSGSYKFIKTERKQEAEPVSDLPDNRDHIYSGYLKWSGLDFMEVKAGYEKLIRSADYRIAEPPDRRFAYSAQDRDTFRASIDLFPIDNFNFSFGYAYKDADYKELLGLKGDKRHAFDLYADYTFTKIAKVYAFSDFEWIRYRQTAQPLDAAGTPVGNWKGETKDRSWGYGIGTEFYVIPNKLTLIFQHDYLKSNGSVDYTLSNGLFVAATGLGPGTGANNENIDLGRWDDYTLYSFKIKAVYNFTKWLAASLGYGFEKFKYNDAQLDNYRFINPRGGPVAGTNGAYLTGAYKDQSYKAHLVFGSMTFKF